MSSLEFETNTTLWSRKRLRSQARFLNAGIFLFDSAPSAFFLEAQCSVFFSLSLGLGALSPTSGALLLRVREPVDSASNLNVLALFPWGSLRVWKQEAGRREFMERPRFLGD